MRLTLKKKLSLLIVVTLAVSITILAVIAVYSIRNKAKQDLQTFKQEELEKSKKTLESYVDHAFALVLESQSNLNDKEFIQNTYGLRLQNIVDMAYSNVEDLDRKVQNGELSLAAAQQRALEYIKAIRYDDGTGYLWVNDTQLPYPNMVMHPTVPALDGTVLDDPKYNCAMGKEQNLFQAMAEQSLEKGEGFVDYVWPKPTPNGMLPDVDKLSYVKYFKEWDWVIGTGIYIDDVRSKTIAELKNDIAKLRYDNNKGYYFIHDTQLPYPKMVMHPIQPQLDGTVLDNEKYNCVKGTNQNFWQRMAEVALEQDSGYVEYMFPKPGGDKAEPKLTYVRYYEPFDWVIGTGVYTDDIDAAIAIKEAEMNEQLQSLVLTIILVSVILIALGSFAALKLAGSLSSAVLAVRDRLQDLAKGKRIEKITEVQSDEIGEMTQSLNHLADGFDNYTGFAREIGRKNLEADFQVLSDEDQLGNSLLQMREDLKKASVEDKNRSWFNEGIAKIGDIMRKNNEDIANLTTNSLTELIKYLDINQGAIYVIENENDNEVETCLEMKSCFAYGRKKHLSQKIMVGEGLVGQCVLEKKHILLTEVPDNYVRITSGLGESTPKCLIIIPLIYNDEVKGVLELASFRQFEEHEVEFLLKVAESMAATIASVKTNEMTKKLLEHSQQMTEEIRAQEEELRQNSEELLATQEELNRKLMEIERENEELQEELNMQRQLSAAKKHVV